jgi:hypothetical protein
MVRLISLLMVKWERYRSINKIELIHTNICIDIILQNGRLPPTETHSLGMEQH